MNVNEVIDEVINREGGYVDNPADRGGPTNFGITEAVARAQGYMGDMRALPRDEAVAIYTRLYWLRPGLDAVAAHAPALAAKLLDIAVNMGPATAIGFLRRALNALTRTISALTDSGACATASSPLITVLAQYMVQRGAEGEAVLIKAVNALQGAQYVAIAERQPADRAFVYGWLKNRIG